jgi:hypothetical protein
VAGHDQKSSCFKGVTSSDQIERVLDVVRSRAQQDTGLAQGIDCCQATGSGRRLVPTLQEEIRLWEGHHAHTGIGYLSGDGSLNVRRLHAEGHAVAGCHRVCKTGVVHHTRKLAEEEDLGVQHLVHM